MTRSDDTAPVPDLHLERYLLGELPEDERGRIERLLELDPDLEARLGAIERSNVEIAGQYPPETMAQEIRGRARVQRAIETPRTTTSSHLAAWWAPAVAATTVALAVGAVMTSSTIPTPSDGLLFKGTGAELVVYRKTSTGSERLESGARATAGDLIRVGYRAAGQMYGAIVSTDGDGSVIQHLPRTGERAAALEAGGTVLLGFSYELDEAPRWERFYLVTAMEPFGLETVRRAAGRAALTGSEKVPPHLDLPPQLAQSVFSLTKETKR